MRLADLFHYSTGFDEWTHSYKLSGTPARSGAFRYPIKGHVFYFYMQYKEFSRKRGQYFSKHSDFVLFVSCFFAVSLKKCRVPPFLSRCKCLPGNRKRIQIGTSKHGIQPIFVFSESAVSYFLVAKLAFDDAEYVLYFASNG